MKQSLSFTAILALLAVSAASAAEHTVEIKPADKPNHFLFSPDTLQVQAGDTVKWVNTTTATHNIISKPSDLPAGAAPLKSQVMTTQGETFSYTFQLPGHYAYVCAPHMGMGMKGSVDVLEAKTGPKNAKK